MVGMLIPLLLVPEEFRNAHVAVKVVCLGTIYDMENRYAKGDQSASIFNPVAYLISAYLGFTLPHAPTLYVGLGRRGNI
jgi:hypothetical protein